MPAQPRKRAPRKTTALKVEKPTPADAAEAEADGSAEDGAVVVDFRGEKFTISQQARASWRAVHFARTGRLLDWFAEVIDPADYDRLIAVGKFRESFADVTADFFEAFKVATGQGNS